VNKDTGATNDGNSQLAEPAQADGLKDVDSGMKLRVMYVAICEQVFSPL